MNNDNEPVAWMSSVGGEFVYVGYEPAEGYLAIPLYTHPAKEPTKQKYDDCMKDCDEPNPVERLRFFLSCALTGQDWLDVEPFIDAIAHPAKTLTDEEIIQINIDEGTCWDVPHRFAIQIARAILRKANEK